MTIYSTQQSYHFSALPSSPFHAANPNQHCIGSIDSANQHKLLMKRTPDRPGTGGADEKSPIHTIDPARLPNGANRPRARSNLSKKDLVHQQLCAVQDSLAQPAPDATTMTMTSCLPPSVRAGFPPSPFASPISINGDRMPSTFGSLPLPTKLSILPRLSVVAASAAGAAAVSAAQQQAAAAAAAQPRRSTAPPSSSLPISPAPSFTSSYEQLDGLSQKPSLQNTTTSYRAERLQPNVQAPPSLPSSQSSLSSSPLTSQPHSLTPSAVCPSNTSVTTSSKTVEEEATLALSPPPSPAHERQHPCESTGSSLRTKTRKNKNKHKNRQRTPVLTSPYSGLSHSSSSTLVADLQQEAPSLDSNDQSPVTSTRSSIATLSRPVSCASYSPSSPSSSSISSSYSFSSTSLPSPFPSSPSSLSSSSSFTSSASASNFASASSNSHHTTAFAIPTHDPHSCSRSPSRAAPAPRKRSLETPTLTPLDTKPSRLYPPAFNASRESLSSLSTMLSSTGSSPTAPTFSEASTAASSPISPTSSTNIPSPSSSSVHDLASIEASHISSLKNVSDTLNQLSGNVLASSKKESAGLRTLVKRWNELIRVHSSFQEDLSKYDVKEAANALNVLLVTLEPTLMDHGRDLGSALKKLVRTDQKNEHALADWDAALRLPLEHLHAYDIWLQRVDPALTFSKEPRAHVAGLSHRLKLVTDASPHSKGMLRRLSTIARGVMKRRSAANLSGLDQLPEEPLTPTSPTTVMSMGLNDSSITGSTTLTTGAKAKQNMSFSGKDDTKSPSNSSEDTLETMMDPAVDEIAELAVKPRRSIFPRRSLDSARPLSGWFSDALSSSRHKELDQQSSAAAALPPAPRTAGAATTTASGVPIKHEPLPKRYSLFIEPDENDTFSVQSFVKELKLDSYLFDDIVVESPTHTGASTPSPPSPRPASSRLSTKSVRNDNDSILTIPSTHQNTEMTTVSYDINFSKDEDYNTSSSVDDTNEPGTPTTPTAMQTTTSTAAEARRTSSFKSTQSYRRTSSSSQSHMSPRQRQGRHQESIGGVVASTAKNLEASLASSSGSTLSKASSFESVQTKRSMTSSIAPASPATTLASNKDIGELDVASLPPLPPPTSTVTSPVTSPVAVSKALPMQQPYKPKSTGQLAPLRPKTPLTIATPAVPLSPLLSPLRSTPSSVASTPTSPSYPVVSKDLMALRRANMMAKAECLQMPRDIVPKNGVDQLRMTNVKQKAEKKPPVRSLISFWEQVSDPADL